MYMSMYFLCGPHCSGKTSILKKLYDEGILNSIGSEIGKDLFYQRHFQTALQNKEYEYEVTNLEIARDHKFVDTKGLIGIETWHPGNLAYAMIRNPIAVPRLKELMLQSPLLSDAIGIRLHVSYETILKRTVTFNSDREWAAGFYTKIENCLDDCLLSLGLLDRCISIDSNRSFDLVYNDIKKYILLNS